MTMQFHPRMLAAIALLSTAAMGRAESLVIDVGNAKIQSAAATGVRSKSQAKGVVADRTVKFENLLPGERYDVTLTPADQNKAIRLIDLSWHSDAAPPAPQAEPLSDDDRKEIREIVTDIKTFTNKNEILHLVGTADRAVALVELTRDTDFHARQGDEIIWRIEIWYFENQAGGWAKVQQQNRVLERVRFKTSEEFEKTRSAQKWIGVEPGLRVERGKDAVIKLP